MRTKRPSARPSPRPPAPPAASKSRRTIFMVLPVLVALAAGTVWLRLSIVRTSYAINQMETKIRAARQSREELVLKASALRSPRRLEALARNQFGLSTPRTDQVIHMTSAHPQTEPGAIK